MALITCPECGKEISSSALQCPHCGYALKKKSKGFKYDKSNRKYAVIGCIVFVIGIVFQQVTKEIYKDKSRVDSDYVACMTSASVMEYGGIGISIGSIAGPLGSLIGGGIGAVGGGVFGYAPAKNRSMRSQLSYDYSINLSGSYKYSEVKEVYNWLHGDKRPSSNDDLRMKLRRDGYINGTGIGTLEGF